MKFRSLFLFASSVLTVAFVHAATIDMGSPRRAVGTDDGIRIDAQLMNDFVSPQSPVVVMYQIQNSSPNAIAIADRVCDVSYDPDSRLITVSIGSEIPPTGEKSKLVTIQSGGKRTFTATGALRAAGGPARGLPQFVQVRVSVLRDATVHAEQFDRWLEVNTSILLNAIPVFYRVRESIADASKR